MSETQIRITLANTHLVIAPTVTTTSPKLSCPPRPELSAPIRPIPTARSTEIQAYCPSISHILPAKRIRLGDRFANMLTSSRFLS